MNGISASLEDDAAMVSHHRGTLWKIHTFLLCLKVPFFLAPAGFALTLNEAVAVGPLATAREQMTTSRLNLIPSRSLPERNAAVECPDSLKVPSPDERCSAGRPFHPYG